MNSYWTKINPQQEQLKEQQQRAIKQQPKTRQKIITRTETMLMMTTTIQAGSGVLEPHAPVVVS